MKLEYVSGCIVSSLTVDGVEEIHMTDEQRKDAWRKICLWMAEQDGRDLNYLLQFVVPQFGEHSSSDEPCGCCGDWIDTWMLDIDKEKSNE